MSEEILGSRYRLGGILGAGGMGVVWRAYDEVLDRQVAVKLLAPQYARDADSRRRTLAEARAAARLTHPHIASVYDYGESENAQGNLVPYVVMELLHGRSLHDRLQRGDLSVEVSLRICAEVASALAMAHAHGLVHRDVKPGNVMLTPGGAKVVDFGLAAVAGERDREEDANVLGTPAYLAPERLNGHPVVAATDVYALGLLLYRLLAGRLPWTAETSTQMLEAHVYLEPTPLPKLPGVPPVVRKLVHRCLAKEPAERPNSSEVTVTLAHAAGIHVPLGSDNDDLDGDYEQEWSSSPSTSSGSVGSGGRLSAPLVGVAPDDPYAVRLTKHLDRSLDHVNLRRQASMLLRGAVGFDLAIWAVLDPATLMWASCVIDGGPHDERFEHELFANEYGQDDVLKLVDLTGDHRIGTVSGATRGDPLASRRFRNVLAPRGFTDELRQTFYDENGTWGALLLYRAEGQFRNDDIAQIAAAGPNFGATLSQALERPDPGAPVAVPDDPVLAAEPERPADRPAGRAFRLPRPRLPRSGRTGGGEPVRRGSARRSGAAHAAAHGSAPGADGRPDDLARGAAARRHRRRALDARRDRARPGRHRGRARPAVRPHRHVRRDPVRRPVAGLPHRARGGRHRGDRAADPAAPDQPVRHPGARPAAVALAAAGRGRAGRQHPPDRPGPATVRVRRAGRDDGPVHRVPGQRPARTAQGAVLRALRAAARLGRGRDTDDDLSHRLIRPGVPVPAGWPCPCSRP